LWIYFFSRKDKNKEPIEWLILAIVLGMIATYFSLKAQQISDSFITNVWSKYLIFAFIEEFFKFFFIWLIIFHHKVFNEAIDAMVYMMFSALGFAFVENFLYASAGDTYVQAFAIIIFRFLSANLLHIVSSSLIGFGYAISLLTRSFYPFFLSFSSGFTLHFLYNYIIKQSAMASVIGSNISFLGFIPVLLWLGFLVVLKELNYLSHE
jgi:RsiW-degrading membrane proteinase PrsW (M82 family)